MPTKPLQTVLIITGYVLALNAAAETFDGSKPLLCASIDTVECGARADCQPHSPESLRFPPFLNIDTGNKRISATRPDGSALNAVITTVAQLDDRLVLQGVENSLGWTISISRATGRMAVAIAGDQIAFSVFGACTVR